MLVHLMEDLAEPVAVEDIQSMPPVPCARRRLVQSTLFPTSKNEEISKTDDFRTEENYDDKEEEDEEQEEWASNGKKRTRNSSAKKKKTDNKYSSKTTPRCGAADNKVAADREDIPSMKVDEGVSPGKKIPRKPKEKKTKTTPKKKVVNGGQKEPVSKKSLSGILSAEPTQQLIPNLRLEAKLIAEENSRLFAGRQVHPFFSSLKTSKKNQVIIDVENTCCSAEWKEPGLGFNPIHVFDTVEEQDKALFLDWGDWSLYDRSPLSNSYDLGVGASSAYQVHVKPLQFDDISRVGNPATASLSILEISPNDCHIKLKEDCPSDRNKAPSTSMAMCDNWLGSNAPRSYSDQQENCLWTDKFHPRKAVQMCGNSEPVRYLIEWLSMWYEKGSQASKSTFHDDEDDTFGQDNDYCYQSDTDSEKLEGDTSLKNVLLVTGPVGSGKSAAIYACAEEQGFQVIEVNASDWRNGALVKQRFGEALESHWLQRRVDNLANPGKTSSLSSSEIIEVTEGSETEFVPLSDEDLQLNYKMSSKSAFGEKRIHETQNATKTLILFEDVDVVFGEDHGFLSSIQQLSRTAKRPMILTANSNNPVLPNNLKRLEVSFSMPTSEELLGLGLFICEAESLKVCPWLMNKLVDSCQGDIRKTLIQLQFWCQGQSSRKGDGSWITFGQCPFDLQSGHHLLPKLIPWGCASQLSEIIEEEITKSLAMIEEQNNSIKIVAEQSMDGRLYKNLRFDGAEADCINARKEAILNLHCLTPIKDDLLALPDCTLQTSNSSGSPVALFRRNVRRKIEMVVSSDSEEDNLGDCAGTNFVGAFCDETRTKKNEKSSSCGHHFIEGSYHQTDNFEGNKVEQACTTCSENGTPPQTDGVCLSMDMSCVPESSFVPETEFVDNTVVYSSDVSCSILHKQEADSINKNAPTDSLSIDFGNLFAGNHDMLANCSSIDLESIHGEEVGDSHLGHVEIHLRKNPLLDECSRIDFFGRVKNFKRLRSHQQNDSVQETWTRLRTCNIDLQHYVTDEEKDALLALKFVSGMSNIISEVDLLLRSCQPHIFDSVEPPLLPFEDSQLCSWYDDHLHMSSTTAQHGICFYTKKINALGSKRGSLNSVDLTWEMLFSSTDKMAFGKLLGLDGKMEGNGKTESQICSSSLRRSREMDLSLCSMLQSLVPPRAHLSMRGGAFHEYLVSLTKISKLESLRLSEQTAERKQRRKRAARHYLNSGPCSLSLEDISMLSQHSCYRKSLPDLEIQAIGKTSSE